MEHSLEPTTTNMAADLIHQATETATTALNIQYIQRDITDIKQAQKDSAAKMETALKNITDRDDNYVKKEEFFFWRNLLVSGMLLSIFLGVIVRVISK